ncbi:MULTISPECIES: deoxyribose-phosphate aldolase [Clostridium]|uniref:deoxyribose-phosphate aldolase n=1 Tax=Clostridium TaxID=1485 RepID=UPI00069E7779|nr:MULTISPECIES: deoxyribose-phosphate aldolase [Clostridium]KOF58086.1 deoxyribose-phosphate aldolase [Clostridium sp. DMHC 10]MCD2347724.1 deoxyribose-phosphate aldolase [Clostridium guangxiense]
MKYSKMIDHTLLKPDAREKQVNQIIEEALKYEFASVCINPTWVKFAADKLKDSEVAVCTVIGFPLGAGTTNAKVFEARDAIENGADEIDMVINIGALKDRKDDFVEREINEVVKAANGKAMVKVIIETCLLSDEEKVRACKLAVKAGADFVKTSTGFSTEGATEKDVELMRKTVGENIGVKASGGIHSKTDMDSMIKAGASRIGASAGVKIMEDYINEK